MNRSPVGSRSTNSSSDNSDTSSSTSADVGVGTNASSDAGNSSRPPAGSSSAAPPSPPPSPPQSPSRAGSIAIILLALLGAGTLTQLYLASDYSRARFARAVAAPAPEEAAASAATATSATPAGRDASGNSTAPSISGATTPGTAAGAGAAASSGNSGSTLRRFLDARRVRVRLGAWPLEPYAITLFLLILVVQLAAEAWAPGETGGRFRFYLFCLAIAGLSGALWGLSQVAFDGRAISWPHRTALLSVAGIFLITAWSPYAPLRTLARHAGRDAWTLLRRPPLWMAVALAFGIAGLKARTPASAGPTPTGDAFEPWFAAQPRVAMPVSADGARALLVKFNDYQCPPCNRTQQAYQPLLDRLAQESPAAFRFVTVDYPLETECNRYVSRDVHPAACEAAVAVRLARGQGKDRALADWLWTNQKGLTRESVLRAAREVGGVMDFDARYDATLADVRADVEKGHALDVSGTPTFFLNGVRLPGLDVADLETALRHELRAAPAPNAATTAAAPTALRAAAASQ